MNNKSFIEALAKEAVSALTDEWQIGTTSRFCDEPADWDYANDDDIAAKLIPFLKRAQSYTNKKENKNER